MSKLKTLLCRTHVISHDWRWESTADSNRFQRCVRCGKVYEGQAGHWGGGLAGS